jgi:phosphoserine phosphatase
VRAFCRDVLTRRRHDAQVHPEALAILRWALSRGARVLVVSASPRDMVEEAVAHLQVDAANVLASTPHYDSASVMLAEIDHPIPYGPGKVRAIRAAIGGAPLYAAFGDNAFDVAMLKDARVPVAVRPKERLRERASEVRGIVELAAE